MCKFIPRCLHLLSTPRAEQTNETEYTDKAAVDRMATAVEGYPEGKAYDTLKYLDCEHAEVKAINNSLNKQNGARYPTSSRDADGDLRRRIGSIGYSGIKTRILTVGDRMTSSTPVMIRATHIRKLNDPIAAPRPHGRYTEVHNEAMT